MHPYEILLSHYTFSIDALSRLNPAELQHRRIASVALDARESTEVAVILGCRQFVRDIAIRP